MSEHVAERCPRCGSKLEGRNPYLPSYGRYECGSYERDDTATIECYRRQLAQALEGFRLMAEILRGLEWSGWDERFRAHMCPVCGGYKSKHEHFPDCDLNKALSFLRDDCGENDA